MLVDGVVMSLSMLGTSYSATVRLELHVGDQIFDLHEIGPESISPRKPVSLDPTEAEVVMYIDGRRRSWQVELPDGLSADAGSARIVILK